MTLHQETENGLLLAWPTPILSRTEEDPAMLAGLRETILAREAAHPEGISRALVNGWHSETDLMEWTGAGIDAFRSRLGRTLGEYFSVLAGGERVRGAARVTAWANVSRRGGFHRLHTHHSAMVSGVFYVDTGRPDPDDTEFNGTICFADPRNAVEMIQLPGQPFGDKLKFDPRPGMLLLFPSWLKHFVDPFRGEGTRISIAFNVVLQPQSDNPADTPLPVSTDSERA
jgi:uncharacterized protein (TIGR02466 family)